MSASRKLAVLCGMLTCGGPAIAQETDPPDLAFLEYLGSWEGSDEDWKLFSEQERKETESDDDGDETDPAPPKEKVAELDDEN